MGEPLYTIALIAINVVVSIIGFNNRIFFDRYALSVGNILAGKQYERVVSSGFLHVGWIHLIFNMIALYYFGAIIEFGVSWVYFLALYFLALLAGSGLAIFLHRRNYAYRAVGASGAVSGVVFASVLFMPQMEINIYFLIPVPGWAFAIIYTLYTLYGMKNKSDNIGHEAHLGGALVGMIMAIAYLPEIVVAYWWLVLLLFVPIGLYFFFYFNPAKSQLASIWLGRMKKGEFSRKSAAEENKVREFKRVKYERGDSPSKALQRELDELLDKVARKGMNGLSANEKARLQELSQRLDVGAKGDFASDGRANPDSDMPGRT